MKHKLNFQKAYRSFLRLLTNTIVAYSVIVGLIGGSFGVGRLYESYKSDKELNNSYLDWLKETESFNKEIFELRKANIELSNEINELKQKRLKDETRK